MFYNVCGLFNDSIILARERLIYTHYSEKLTVNNVGVNLAYSRHCPLIFVGRQRKTTEKFRVVDFFLFELIASKIQVRNLVSCVVNYVGR